MAEGVRRTAAAVFGLTLAALIPFWIIKGTQPSGHAVLWALYGLLIASGLTWLVATFLIRGREREAKESLTPLERWLQGRISAQESIAREHVVRDDYEYLKQMSAWDAQNVSELTGLDSKSLTFDHSAAIAPRLADSYRSDPRNPGRIDGIGPRYTVEFHDAYYRRRLDWLEERLSELRASRRRHVTRWFPGARG